MMVEVKVNKIQNKDRAWITVILITFEDTGETIQLTLNEQELAKFHEIIKQPSGLARLFLGE